MVVYQWAIEEKNKPILKDLSRFAFRDENDALNDMIERYFRQYLYNMDDLGNGRYLFYHTNKRTGLVGYVFSTEVI